MADTMGKRLKGLLGRSGLDEDTCMVIAPCNCIHTMGMKFSIDVLFLDEQGRIIRIIEDMRPGRISPIVRKSKRVVEMLSSNENKDRWDIRDLIEIVD